MAYCPYLHVSFALAGSRFTFVRLFHGTDFLGGVRAYAFTRSRIAHPRVFLFPLRSRLSFPTNSTFDFSGARLNTPARVTSHSK